MLLLDACLATIFSYYLTYLYPFHPQHLGVSPCCPYMRLGQIGPVSSVCSCTTKPCLFTILEEKTSDAPTHRPARLAWSSRASSNFAVRLPCYVTGNQGDEYQHGWNIRTCSCAVLPQKSSRTTEQSASTDPPTP